MKHGIEQEIQIVEPQHVSLVRDKIDDLLRSIRQWPEISTFADFGRDGFPTQLEYWIGVFGNLFVLGSKLFAFRRICWEKANALGLGLMACGVNPISKTSTFAENFGEHHHIGVNSAKEALLLHNLIRLFSPELIAFSSNSPFYNNQKTDKVSFRLHRSPHCQFSPFLQPDEEIKIKWLSHSPNAVKERYWDITPFVKKGRQTVEVRLFDVSPSCHRSVAYACLLQGLYKKLTVSKSLSELLTDSRLNKSFDDILFQNRLNAIDYGLEATFDYSCHPIRAFIAGKKVSAVHSLETLRDWLWDDIESLDDYENEITLNDIVDEEIFELKNRIKTTAAETAEEYAIKMVDQTSPDKQNSFWKENFANLAESLSCIGNGYCLDDGMALRESGKSSLRICPKCDRIHPGITAEESIAFNADQIHTLSCTCGSTQFLQLRGDIWICNSCGKRTLLSFFSNCSQCHVSKEHSKWNMLKTESLIVPGDGILRIINSNDNPKNIKILTRDGRLIDAVIGSEKTNENIFIDSSYHSFDMEWIGSKRYIVVASPPGSKSQILFFDDSDNLTKELDLRESFQSAAIISDFEKNIYLVTNYLDKFKLSIVENGNTKVLFATKGFGDILAANVSPLRFGMNILLITRKKGLVCIDKRNGKIIWETAASELGNPIDLSVHPVLDFMIVADIKDNRLLFIDGAGSICRDSIHLNFCPSSVLFSPDGRTMHVGDRDSGTLYTYKRGSEYDNELEGSQRSCQSCEEKNDQGK